MMKTTLILPDDVTEALRLESARRGGRKAASLSSLVTDAVRKVYPASIPRARKIELQPGRVIIGAGTKKPSITPQDVAKALYDDES